LPVHPPLATDASSRDDLHEVVMRLMLMHPMLATAARSHEVPHSQNLILTQKKEFDHVVSNM